MITLHIFSLAIIANSCCLDHRRWSSCQASDSWVICYKVFNSLSTEFQELFLCILALWL